MNSQPTTTDSSPRTTTLRRTLLVLLALLALALVPLVATAGDGHRGGKGKHHKAYIEAMQANLDTDTAASLEALHSWTRGHLELAHVSMEAGDFATAAAHLDTVIGLQVDPDFEARVKTAHEAARSQLEAERAAAGDDDDARADKKKRGKRGHRGKGLAGGVGKQRVKLYMMSARAHAKDGNQELALQRLDEGIAEADKLGSDKMVERLTKLRDNPDKLTAERGDGKKSKKKWGKNKKKRGEVDVAAVEQRIRDAESKLPLAR